MAGTAFTGSESREAHSLFPMTPVWAQGTQGAEADTGQILKGLACQIKKSGLPPESLGATDQISMSERSLWLPCADVLKRGVVKREARKPVARHEWVGGPSTAGADGWGGAHQRFIRKVG